MSVDRRLVLGGVAAAVSLLSAAILFEVLGTVFLAVSVAYVLRPLRDGLSDLGIPVRYASLLSALLSLVAAGLLFVPFGILLYFRRAAIRAALRELPASIPVTLFGYTVVVDLLEVQRILVPDLPGLALSLARSAAVLGTKLGLFAFVVYGVLFHAEEIGRGLRGLVPPGYDQAADRLHRRLRDTLFGLYVRELVIAAITYDLALAVFLGFRYPLPFTLALAAALLRLIPILSPALLVAGLVVYHAAVGEVVTAVTVGIVAGIVVVLLPYRVIGRSLFEDIPAVPVEIYVTGFVGGLLTVGAIGIVVGPVVLAVLVELLAVLAVGTTLDAGSPPRPGP